MSFKTFVTNFATFLIALGGYVLLLLGFLAINGEEVSPPSITPVIALENLNNAFGVAFLCCVGIMMLFWALPPTPFLGDLKNTRYAPLLFTIATFYAVTFSYIYEVGYGIVFSSAAVIFAGLFRYFATHGLETALLRGRTAFILLIDAVAGFVVAFAVEMFTVNNINIAMKTGASGELAMIPCLLVNIAIAAITAMRGGVFTSLINVACTTTAMLAFFSSDDMVITYAAFYYIGAVTAHCIAVVVAIAMLCKSRKTLSYISV